jgi:hypothetical protein
MQFGSTPEGVAPHFSFPGPLKKLLRTTPLAFLLQYNPSSIDPYLLMEWFATRKNMEQTEAWVVLGELHLDAEEVL